MPPRLMSRYTASRDRAIDASSSNRTKNRKLKQPFKLRNRQVRCVTPTFRQSSVDSDSQLCRLTAFLAQTPADRGGEEFSTTLHVRGELKISRLTYTKPQLRGGPLGGDVYKLQQWHCHWGAADGEGSEHTVDGRAFSGELHLVHWNTSKYHSFAEAAGQPDGLAVLGVLLMVGSKHEELEKVVRLLPFIQHKGDKVTMSEPLDPAQLLPSRTAYWTYPGSLTTPPCTESVTWILFKDPIQVSGEQLALMRKLRCGEASCGVEAMELLHNYRPTLPLGNRELRDYGGN
ncbi:Carbonic anhydrase 13 [Papilio xuthus]|uniref:Carbonic anhydrase n=1 Tax=Papilio xuthus TaxID=66420 RepID=A0A194PPV8_PAPXU|nr:Carbonic anhydrase 13 [Papilio xuthus]